MICWPRKVLVVTISCPSSQSVAYSTERECILYTGLAGQCSPCPATPVYIYTLSSRFQTKYYVTERDNKVCGRFSVSQKMQFRRCIFSTNIIIFRHLKLEIALAIPASNKWKTGTTNPAAQGLTQKCCSLCIFSTYKSQTSLKHCSAWRFCLLLWRHTPFNSIARQ